jgi:hypothetical protein
MKIKFIIALLSVFSLLSCVVVSNKIEELKPIENYSTLSTSIANPNAMDAEITFINDKKVNTRIKGEKNIFYGFLNETTINKYFAIYDNAGKKNYISYEIVKKMTFKDYKSNERVFINRGNRFNSLHEVLYDGKIKWYREFYSNPYDQSTVIIEHFVNENNLEVRVAPFSSIKNKLKEVTNSRPELKIKIENLSKIDNEKIIEILQAYEK